MLWIAVAAGLIVLPIVMRRKPAPAQPAAASPFDELIAKSEVEAAVLIAERRAAGIADDERARRMSNGEWVRV